METTEVREIEVAYLTVKGKWLRKTLKNQRELEKWFDKNGEKYIRVEVRVC